MQNGGGVASTSAGRSSNRMPRPSSGGDSSASKNTSVTGMTSAIGGAEYHGSLDESGDVFGLGLGGVHTSSSRGGPSGASAGRDRSGPNAVLSWADSGSASRSGSVVSHTMQLETTIGQGRGGSSGSSTGMGIAGTGGQPRRRLSGNGAVGAGMSYGRAALAEAEAAERSAGGGRPRVL